jgi:hypothetical protein
MRTDSKQVMRSSSIQRENYSPNNFPTLFFILILVSSFVLFIAMSFIRVRASNIKANFSQNWSERSISTGQIRLREISAEVVAYNGESEARQIIEHNQAIPLSLASADFDEDGRPDVISGYAYSGRGILTLCRAKKASDPLASDNEPFGVGDYAQSPFLSQGQVFELASAPDFLGIVDFDHDGHADVIVAARGSNKIHLLLGDGRGGLTDTEAIMLPGRVTALAAGGFNLAGSLTDLAVGIEDEDGAKLLVFGKLTGMPRTTPEVLTLPSQANSLLLLPVDDDYSTDLVVGAEQELLIIHGYPEQIAIDENAKSLSIQERTSTYSLPSKLISLAAGNFTGGHRADVAALTETGAIYLVSEQGINDSKRIRNKHEGLRRLDVLNAHPNFKGDQLACSRVLGGAADELLIVDRPNQQLHILKGGSLNQASLEFDEMVTIDSEGEPVALLPMKLNEDAFHDLVMLKSGRSGFTILMATPVATITVNNTADTNTRDSLLTLREAILLANGTLPRTSLTPAEQFQVVGTPTSASFDSIKFSIFPSSGIISVGSSGLGALPVITDQITIDGFYLSFVGNFGVLTRTVLEGFNAGINADGLVLATDSSMVRGLVIRFFGASCLVLSGPPNGRPNAATGSNIITSNMIGGISFLTNAPASDGPVSTSLAAAGTGISVISSNNIIGATGIEIGSFPAGNIIFSNSGNGIEIDSGARANLVQANFIGTDTTGVLNRGNGLSGIFVNGSGNTIGARLNADGTVATTGGNVIAFNRENGIRANVGTRNLYLLNKIYSNAGVPIEILPLGVNPDTPVLDAANYFPTMMRVTGSLRTDRSTSWRMLFYQCDATNQRNGDSLDSTGLTVTTTANVPKSFSFDYRNEVTGGAITCQGLDPTIDAKSPGGSTEYSQCTPICAYAVTSTRNSFTSDNGSGSVRVTVTTGCDWTAVARSTGEWIRITSVVNNTGTKDVNFTVSANPTSASRSGAISITTRTLSHELTITQAGVIPMITIAEIKGKKLIVTGKNFELGASILVDGKPQKKTSNDSVNPTTILIDKKAGKKKNIPSGDHLLQVQNPGGPPSPAFSFRRP